jgi:hypothetical protein
MTMTTISGACCACGQPLATAAAGTFGQAALVAPLCRRCADQQFLDQGGAVLALWQELPRARFALGKITVTAGAVEALAEAKQHAVEFLQRHVQGDWGLFGNCDRIELTADEQRRGWEATDNSGKINKSNLLNRRDSVMGEYATARGRRLWVITQLGGSGQTAVLLPEDY